MMKEFSRKVLILSICLLMISCGVAQELKFEFGKIHAALDSTVPTGIKGPSVLQLPGYFIWGGSVVKGDDHKYHMLFSLWESGLEDGSFTQNWVLESKIGYAVSDYPDRDFKFQKIVLKGARYDGDSTAWDAQMVHNPHLKKFEDTYYLYYIGARDPGQRPEGSTGENLNKRARVQQSLCTGVISFDRFEDLINGRFERPEKPLLTPRTRVKSGDVLMGSPPGVVAKPDNLIVVNPSVDYNMKTKKYMLFFKGNIYEPHWKGAHGVATSDSPTGPFIPKDQFIFDIKMPDGSIASTEDPYVWYVPGKEKFMAIVKDFSGRLTGFKKTLALLESEDGFEWELAANPLFTKRELVLQNGEHIEVNRMERPQLLLDNEGIPLVLYVASSLENVNPKNDGSSVNIQIPLIATYE